MNTYNGDKVLIIAALTAVMLTLCAVIGIVVDSAGWPKWTGMLLGFPVGILWMRSLIIVWKS